VLLLRNVNPKIVSERLGHAKIEITLNTYNHVLASMQELATEKLGTFMSAIAATGS
jgi:hypothetical protein